MTNEEFNQLRESIDSLATTLSGLESKTSSLEGVFTELKSKQTDLESKFSDFLKTPGAQSAVAPTQVDPVTPSDGPKSVLADIDLVNDFETALSKVEEEYGK